MLWQKHPSGSATTPIGSPGMNKHMSRSERGQRGAGLGTRTVTWAKSRSERPPLGGPLLSMERS